MWASNDTVVDGSPLTITKKAETDHERRFQLIISTLRSSSQPPATAPTAAPRRLLSSSPPVMPTFVLHLPIPPFTAHFDHTTHQFRRLPPSDKDAGYFRVSGGEDWELSLLNQRKAMALRMQDEMKAVDDKPRVKFLEDAPSIATGVGAQPALLLC